MFFLFADSQGIEMQMASGVDKVFIVVKIFDYLSLKLDALYAFDFQLPLFFSVARGSQVCSTSCDGYEHKQNGGWLPLEASAEDLSSGFLFILITYPFLHSVKIAGIFLRNLLRMQVVYPILRKYEAAPSAPRLKLVSHYDLKSLFSVEDVKLSPWMDGM